MRGFRVYEIERLLLGPTQAWTMMKVQLQWTGNWTVEVPNGKVQVFGQRNYACSLSM